MRLFRSLRNRLLSNQKLSGYLAYAVGEIILVVIGIMIALQINTWNTQNQARENENLYLSEIISELEQDSLAIAGVLEFNQGKQQVITQLMGMFADTLSNADRQRIFEEYSFPFTLYEVFEPNSVAFDNLLQAEGLKLISKREIRKDLSLYYQKNYSEGVQERIIQMNRGIIDAFFPLFFTREAVMESTGISTALPPTEALNIHANQEFISNLFGMVYIINIQDAFLQDVQRENHQLRQTLTAYLKANL